MDCSNHYETKENKIFVPETKEILPSKFGNEDYHPVVRYGSIGKKGVSQWFEFHSPYEPIPDDAEFGSGIYLLTDDEKERLSRLNREGVEYLSGGKLVVRAMQDRCEDESRVLYPVNIESDEGDSWQEQIEWITDFVDEHLPVSIHDCEWFHSGSRSVHCHAPLYVRETGLDRLRMLVMDHDGGLDHQIYQRKNQFRIPGVVHSKTGMKKTPIEPEWDDSRIGKEIVTTDSQKPETYSELVCQWDIWSPFESDPLFFEPGTEEPEEEFLSDIWAAYNNHHFSPYANGGNGKRSIVTAEIDGEAFGKDGEIFIPCYIRVAIGAGHEFAMKERYCPIKLSKRDYRKYEDMDLEIGHTITIIGGGSGSSRIMDIGWETAEEIQDTLTAGNHVARGDVPEAHEILQNRGFETGKAGANDSSKSRKPLNEPSRAKTLQMQAERQGINSLKHEEKVRVACRLLAIDGKESAHQWFKQQLGNDYDRDKTETQLHAITTKYYSIN